MITSIKIKAGGEEVDLSMDEIKELYRELHEFLGKDYTQPCTIPYYPTSPWTTAGSTKYVKPLSPNEFGTITC